MCDRMPVRRPSLPQGVAVQRLVGIGMDPQASKVHWILFPSEQILEYVYYFSHTYYKILELSETEIFPRLKTQDKIFSKTKTQDQDQNSKTQDQK